MLYNKDGMQLNKICMEAKTSVLAVSPFLFPAITFDFCKKD